MKFTKTYGIFLTAFSIGCLFVILFTFNKQTNQEIELHKIYNADKIKQISDVSKSKLEVIEEVDNRWEKIEKKPYKIKMLETGEDFHGDEVDAKSGEKWLGLFQHDNTYVLKETKLKIKRVKDGIVDDDTNQKTGKSVETPEKNEPMFLLKDSNLKSGEVKYVMQGDIYDDIPENTEYVKEFEFNGNKYSLKVVEKLNKENEKLFALVLEGRGQQQVLHTANFNGGRLATLHWVGDLDKDGKPDIYMSPNVHYNVENRVLFLSSRAKQIVLSQKLRIFGLQVVNILSE